MEKEEDRRERAKSQAGLVFMTGSVKGETHSQEGSEVEVHRAESEQREEERKEAH